MAKAARSEDHKDVSWVLLKFELSTANFQPEQRAFDIRIGESDISVT
jgi:hypothetical protein